MKKAFYSLFITLILSSCQDSSYQLSWKIDDGEKLIYLTRMEVVRGQDYLAQKDNSLKLSPSMVKALGDTTNIPFELSDMYNHLIVKSKVVQHFSFLEPENSDISLDIIANRKKEISQPKYPFESFIPAESVFFSGKIKPDNSLQENENNFIQNQIINILFELPKNKVSIGDSWALDLKSFNFSKKSTINKVSLVDIITKNNDDIALLKYRIKSKSNKPDMFVGSINFEGTAEFNITKGKWEHFLGILIFTSKVLTEMKQTQILELNEISQPEYQTLIDSYEKENLNNLARENPSGTENINSNSGKTNNAKCPITYCVQILASDDSLSVKSSVFKGIPFKIEQRIEPSKSKFKYKYVVGNECTAHEALKIREQIIAAGFPNAFIVKMRN